MSTSCKLTVLPDQDRLRLDLYLAATGLVSRRKARDLIDAGSVYVNRKRVRVASRPVRAGDQVEVGLETFQAFDASACVVYSDAELIVAHKPAGVPTSPTRQAARGTLQDALRHHFTGPSPLVVHRLDREASGVLVFARTPGSAAALSQQLSDHHAGRTYLALVEGRMSEPCTAQHFLTISPVARGGLPRVEARSAEGLPFEDERLAISHFTPLFSSDAGSLVEARLETGRTHQLRAQLSALGLPILGDVRYGGLPSPEESPAIALHAWQLRFTHPVDQSSRHFIVPPPPLWSRWLGLTGLTAEALEPILLERLSQPPPGAARSARGESVPVPTDALTSPSGG